MKKHKHSWTRLLLAGAIASAAAAIPVSALATAAGAATNPSATAALVTPAKVTMTGGILPRGLQYLPASAPASVRAAIAAGSESTTGASPAIGGGRGPGCTTMYGAETVSDTFGINLFTFWLYTYWCWNDVIVTTHTTWPTFTHTATGVAWNYDGLVDGIAFHCYTAGDGYSCSGNWEHAKAKITGPSLTIKGIGLTSVVYPWITETERYAGGYTWYGTYTI